MATNKVETYEISKPEQNNDKENTILRTLVGDPKRHKPLAQHPVPTASVTQEAIPAAMYTLETRYRPIPPKALPKAREPRVYNIDSQNPKQTSAPSPVMTKDEPEVPTIVEEKLPQMVSLEPKVILQPVLYSIVAAKTTLVQNNQPVAATTIETPSTLLYATIGQPQRPAINMNAPTLNFNQPAIENSPILYTLVASPRLQVRIQEPLKPISEISEQSSSSLYAVVGNPQAQPSIQEPVKKPLEISKESSPVLYSIIANPTLTSNITYANTPDLLPSATQAIKNSSVPSVPTLYTIVGQTQVPNNIPKDNRPPVAPIKRNANDITMYAIVGDPPIPKSMKTPRKTEPLQPQQQKQVSAPTVYPVVGKPNPLPEEKAEIQLKPVVQKKTPPKSLVPIRRISRSLDRQSAPEPVTEPVTAVSSIKKQRQQKIKEPSIPKSETIFVPLPDNERTPRSKQPRAAPLQTSPERIQRQPHQIPNYDPHHLPDYISPYAYHPLKPYREQTVRPHLLPIITTNRSPRYPRAPVDESTPRIERKRPHDPWTPHSLERYPVRYKEHSRVWDYEHEVGTDIDDDDDENRLNSDRKRKRYRRRRLRTPWIPVW